MRIAILSDIHSNLEALQTSLDVLRHMRIDRYVCLGDLVGYGANPNEVVNLVRELADFTIMGNHDAAVAGKMDYKYYYDFAREVLEWTEEQLSPENQEYLQQMPYIMREGDICYVHGEPIEPESFNYVYTTEQAELLAERDSELAWLTFVGHSHLRRIYEIFDGKVIELPVDNLTFRIDRKYVVAVGSVGQPRDNDPRSCFSVYDDEKKRLEFYRLDYDIDQAAEKIMRAGLPEFFATRLFSGA